MAGTRRPVWVIGAVGVLVAALILPYFQKWLVQRSQIDAARAAVTQSRQEVSVLNEQLAQWKDDQYVKAQARERLHFVMPGETGYVVLPGKDGAGADTTGTDAAGGTSTGSEASGTAGPDSQAARMPTGNRPWYADIWVSAEVAGAADRAP
jgi:Tfp pilus assembly major pilin PilA